MLVVEDDEDTAAALRAALELEGHTVTVAHDRVEGLAALEQGAPQVVVLDLAMPVIEACGSAVGACLSC